MGSLKNRKKKYCEPTLLLFSKAPLKKIHLANVRYLMSLYETEVGPQKQKFAKVKFQTLSTSREETFPLLRALDSGTEESKRGAK